jgi:hypothetical protein
MKPLTTTIRHTLLRCLATEEYEYGRHSDIDDAREFIQELARFWPSLEQVPEGVDRFSHLPVTGAPESVDIGRAAGDKGIALA